MFCPPISCIGADVVQFDSNSPGEDRFAIREALLDNTDIIRAYAVIDGHGGFLAADIVCKSNEFKY